MSWPGPGERVGERPSPLDLAHLYRTRFGPAARAGRAAVWKVLVEHHLQRWVRASDAVLDVGCGGGEFLNHLRARRRIGLDLNPDAGAALAAGIEFHCGPADDLGFLGDGEVDVVFSSNLLEHLSKPEIEHLLDEARRVLRPGGSLLLLGPNVRVIPHTYWDFWDHRTPISDRSLVELLEALGYELVEVVPKFLPYTTVSRLPKASPLVRLYLKVPLAWRVLGAQFFVHARKPR